ncbi:hypothetical protein B0H66DRAFT_211548 [Apodospora peruviana]|uniref:Uncharacterized protein n=1 Tax=Apodospora peruviana TaxID=516989 RepID=A0AAE0ICL6_9PEZI|nr:hypothetical protein B0H66DRAFT_211548 [Apodospora peruviana]
MRPELVIEWRNQLPPPFNRPSPPRRRRTSFDEPLDLQVRCTQALATTTEERDGTIATASPSSRVRRNSAHGALEYSDRRVLWARLARADHQRTQAERVESALEKLRAIFPEKNTPSPAGPGAGPPPPATALVTRFSPLLKRSSSSSTRYSYRGPRVDYPTSKEIAALSAECFPSLHDAPVTITEFSRDSYRVWRYTLGELLESKHLLQPPLACEVRWIFVEYYKLGTFWGSDQRCFQWGTDPALFEASPIPLLQERLRELDDAAGRPTPEEEDIPGR